MMLYFLSIVNTNNYPMTESGCFFWTQVNNACLHLYMKTGTDLFANVGILGIQDDGHVQKHSNAKR
jgi:hypothetical protein